MVAIDLAAVSQPAYPRGQRLVARGDRAAVAQRAEVLGWIKAERAGGAETSDRLAGARCQVRLAAILDDGEIVAGCERTDRRHVRRLPVQVHRQQGRRAWRHRRRGRRRIDRETRGIDVGKHRTRTGHRDRECRVGSRKG